jgi:hypothetical protein
MQVKGVAVRTRESEDGHKKSNMEALSASKPKPRIAPALRETLAGSAGSGRPACRLPQLSSKRRGAASQELQFTYVPTPDTHTLRAIFTTIANTTTLESH